MLAVECWACVGSGAVGSYLVGSVVADMLCRAAALTVLYGCGNGILDGIIAVVSALIKALELVTTICFRTCGGWLLSQHASQVCCHSIL